MFCCACKATSGSVKWTSISFLAIACSQMKEAPSSRINRLSLDTGNPPAKAPPRSAKLCIRLLAHTLHPSAMIGRSMNTLKVNARIALALSNILSSGPSEARPFSAHVNSAFATTLSCRQNPVFCELFISLFISSDR